MDVLPRPLPRPLPRAEARRRAQRRDLALAVAGAASGVLLLVAALGAGAAPASAAGKWQGNQPGQGPGAGGQATPEPTNSPQPFSNADQNGTGANPGVLASCGAFCSTRDGSASENGVGTGQADGRPCAGCVGNADNKNPPGQGNPDANAGFECDRNQGVGQGNPAHTGCTSASPTRSTTPSPSPSVSPSSSVSPSASVGPSRSASPSASPSSSASAVGTTGGGGGGGGGGVVNVPLGPPVPGPQPSGVGGIFTELPVSQSERPTAVDGRPVVSIGGGSPQLAATGAGALAMLGFALCLVGGGSLLLLLGQLRRPVHLS